jgi:hypothetical protein
MLAFGGEYEGAPVVMINHADHLFWLGAGNLSALMNLRQVGAEAAVAVRGYPRENQLVVPTPLPGVARRLSREDARLRLGIDGSRIVAVTLARPVKFAPAPWHPGFVEVVGAALRETPDVILIAVGPDRKDPDWRALAAALPGRVVLAGLQPDPSVHLDAADIYLDSFPFASITSMLEAASRDVPILASRMHRGMQRLMSSVGPLDNVALGASDPRAYTELLAALATDPALRARGGEAAGRVIRERHGADAWAAAMNTVYERATVAQPVRSRSVPTATGVDLAAYAEAVMGIESKTPLHSTIRLCRDGFDAADRRSSLVRTWAVRAVRKAVGSGLGASADTYLIPSGRIA